MKNELLNRIMILEMQTNSQMDSIQEQVSP